MIYTELAEVNKVKYNKVVNNNIINDNGKESINNRCNRTRRFIFE